MIDVVGRLAHHSLSLCAFLAADTRRRIGAELSHHVGHEKARGGTRCATGRAVGLRTPPTAAAAVGLRTPPTAAAALPQLISTTIPPNVLRTPGAYRID